MTVAGSDERHVAAGWAPLLARENMVRFAALASGVTLHATYILVVATIMPSAVADIGGLAFYAWATTLFAVGSIAGAASAAPLLARHGARDAYRLAILLFALGSAGCGAAPNMGVLVVGRALQGIGGGMLAALGYALVTALFADALRSRAIALLSSVWGIAALGGPLLGGVLAEMGQWRAAFWVALPLCLGCALLAGRILPRPGGAAERGDRFPVLRLALLAGAALALSVGSVPGRVAASLAGLVAAVLLLALVLRLDHRAAKRMLPAGALDLRTLTGAVTITMALLVVTIGTSSFMPYVLRGGEGASPLVAGYVAALSSLSWTAATLLAGTAGTAASRRWILAGPWSAPSAWPGSPPRWSRARRPCCPSRSAGRWSGPGSAWAGRIWRRC